MHQDMYAHDAYDMRAAQTEAAKQWLLAPLFALEHANNKQPCDSPKVSPRQQVVIECMLRLRCQADNKGL